MINKYFDIDVSAIFKKSEWKKKKEESKLDFSVPNKKDETVISDDDNISIRDVLVSTSGKKVDFMYSVIMNGYVEEMMPEYINGGLQWLME